MRAWYEEKLPRPDEMKPEAYKRNIAARAYDVARYCLFFGIPTGVGQVVSIRTLEKQVRRLKRPCMKNCAVWVTRSPQAVLTGGVRMDRYRFRRTCLAYADPIRRRRSNTRRKRKKFARVGGAKLAIIRASPADRGCRLVRPADSLSDAVACLLYEVTDQSVSGTLRNCFGLERSTPHGSR